jgi:hypothetical protein
MPGIRATRLNSLWTLKPTSTKKPPAVCARFPSSKSGAAKNDPIQAAEK